ncbi:hypothetical protein NHX12_014113 [Muraenolepis orangiensis]|uniref:Ig-like domain-containing protein n=1 Tax=Muraenolepis orangiensis TaxID=630683 RepID=A0A9Q0DAT8_9TELE|nr:hypothetical protein NHX12_014113 [Muraenolepis orangiensis]
MRFKPTKSRSMVLRKGKVVDKFRFNIADTAIPSFSEKPVKSLGKVFDCSLRDTTSIQSTCTELDGWLKSVDKSGLPGKFKAWVYQHGILPRILWLLLVYAVPISTVETLERRWRKRGWRWERWCSVEEAGLAVGEVVLIGGSGAGGGGGGARWRKRGWRWGRWCSVEEGGLAVGEVVLSGGSGAGGGGGGAQWRKRGWRWGRWCSLEEGGLAVGEVVLSGGRGAGGGGGGAQWRKGAGGGEVVLSGGSGAGGGGGGAQWRKRGWRWGRWCSVEEGGLAVGEVVLSGGSGAGGGRGGAQWRKRGWRWGRWCSVEEGGWRWGRWCSVEEAGLAVGEVVLSGGRGLAVGEVVLSGGRGAGGGGGGARWRKRGWRWGRWCSVEEGGLAVGEVVLSGGSGAGGGGGGAQWRKRGWRWGRWCSVEEAGLAVGEVVGYGSVRSASRMYGNIGMFLDSTAKVNEQWFTEEGPRRLPVNTSLPMALIPCLALAVMLSTVTRCEAITDVAVREINSTRSRSESCVTWLQCAASRSDSGAEQGNYTWTVGNQTYAGARLKYASREAEETATCTVSNPVSRGSASIQLECSNGTYPTDGSMRQDKAFTQLWVYVLSGLGVGLLTLVLVWLLLRRSIRTKADAGRPSCGPLIEKSVGDDMEIGTCSSGRITEAYWKYGNHKITKGLVGKDDSQFKGRVHAITDVAVRELNSTRSRSESCVTWLQCTSSSSDSGAERGNYTWAVGNQTYAGARLKYASREAEETATCTVSNPVSRGSASVQLECSNGTDGSMRRDKSFTQLWVYVLSGLGVGLLTLVLVWLLLRRSRRTKAVRLTNHRK